MPNEELKWWKSSGVHIDIKSLKWCRNHRKLIAVLIESGDKWSKAMRSKSCWIECLNTLQFLYSVSTLFLWNARLVLYTITIHCWFVLSHMHQTTIPIIATLEHHGCLNNKNGKVIQLVFTTLLHNFVTTWWFLQLPFQTRYCGQILSHLMCLRHYKTIEYDFPTM